MRYPIISYPDVLRHRPNVHQRAQGAPKENVKQSWRSGSTLQGAKKECQNEFKVSDEILQQLNHFNLPPPLSDRDITYIGGRSKSRPGRYSYWYI